MMGYLRRRLMVWTTWRLAALNRLLDEWNTLLRNRAVVSRAELVVHSERRKIMSKRLTGKGTGE